MSEVNKLFGGVQEPGAVGILCQGYEAITKDERAWRRGNGLFQWRRGHGYFPDRGGRREWRRRRRLIAVRD